MVNPPQTHEERLARDIERCRHLAKECNLPSTEQYLDIAFKKCRDERAERLKKAFDIHDEKIR